MHERSTGLRSLLLLLLTTAPAVGDDGPIRVAVFKGEGVGASSAKLIAALEAAGEAFEVTRLTGEQIRAGRLAGIDVLVHPGGSGSGQGRALGEEGRVAVRRYVDGGGGFLGVCAGAYLATNDYAWSLNLIDAKVVDRRHWSRGKGEVDLQLSPRGAEFFGREGREMRILYAQGPLLGRREWDDPNVPDYESLAIYKTEIAEKGAPGRDGGNVGCRSLRVRPRPGLRVQSSSGTDRRPRAPRPTDRPTGGSRRRRC